MVCFVERLTLRAWVRSVLPRLLWDRVRGRRVGRCDVLDGSRMAMVVARASRWLTGAAVEWLRFRLVDIRDEGGLLLRLRIAYQDLADVQAEAMNDPAFRSATRDGRGAGRLPAYLAKALATIGLPDSQSIWRTLYVVQVCAWNARRERLGGQRPIAFLTEQPWMKAIVRYGATSGITVVPLRRPFRLKAWVRRRQPPELRAWVWALKAYWQLASPQLVLRLPWRFQGRRILSSDHGAGDDGAHRRRPRIGVQYYGHLNLRDPKRHSDLFFWQRSPLAGSDCLMVFTAPWDPLDAKKWDELAASDIEAVALNARATTLPTVPVFIHQPRGWWTRRKRLRLALPRASLEAAWVRDQVSEYVAVRDYWADLFATCGIKVFVTWFKYDAAHCAMADALEQVGGLLAMYQRAYEFLPSAETTVALDLFFGFSKWGAEIERRSHSVIRYHVTTGYLGDHRFPLLRQEAQRVRAGLQQRGVRRVLGYCDESSKSDERWDTGDEFMRRNYVFLLEHVLAEPWLGLLVKPKAPLSLRKRLGPVATLLQRAEATGRCIVYEDGGLHSSSPPAEAALASDVMVHGHLCAGTAGVEAVLAGVPTLLLDREGWPISPLYTLGDRVVFTDWERLWKACLEHWARPGGIPGFGDWSRMLDDLDPFRDGRAAERMGTYLTWLLEGFKAGLDRDTVMADAAERYAAAWGKDTVTPINGSTDRDGPVSPQVSTLAEVGSAE